MTGQQQVGIGTRLAARLVDGVVVAPLLGGGYALLLLADGLPALLGVALVVLAVAFSFYNQVVRVGRRGQSIGKQVLGLRVQDQDTGAPVGVGRALGRDFVFGLLFAACWVPGLANVVITARDLRRQGWHDKAVRSVVVATGDRAPAVAPADPATGAAAYNPSAPPAAPVSAPPPPPTTGGRPQEETVTPAAKATPPTGMVVGPPPGVVPPPPEPSTPPESSTPVEQTVTPDVAATPSPSPAQPSPAWRLTTAAGPSHVLDGPLLVGRDPDPDLVAGAAAWALDDPQLTMSKTHALLGVEDGTAWVEDWHSTNGVTLHRDTAATALEPHSRTTLREGDVVEFGAFTVTVEVDR
ncbi:RDD family protein [Nocardioides panacisoli]|uniref:RDD family protein n=1 Tax=Nocardioides panacisoli TaxID=627624 RepID=UPI001C635E69|nr:RDD family protein [Nocardioides panacisoli]QYJ05596.1 RDD family protein [Nocardioides panacisoli]